MSSSPKPGAPPPLPDSIGKYKVLARIGRGAMGVVYSARDEVMDRVVALKVMAGDLEAEPDTRARFYREAKVGGQLLHRNITTVFDLGESEGRLFMVMELLRGQPLNQYLSRPEGVSLELKLDLMIQLCEGLAAAHAHGVFHRDIKPSNIYVLDDGTLKILDFGIARLATSTMTATGSIVGTPDYMSPEQTVGSEIDQRSDIFSAGALFYAMLTGNKPFASPDLPTVLRKVQREDPPPITQPDAPAGLVRIVMKALAKKKEDRPQSARELAAALVQFRREWEGEARSIAERAHTVYKTIESLLEEQAHAAERLGLEQQPGQDPVLAAINDEYPIIADRGPDALLRIPFKREVITAIAARLDARRSVLEEAVNRLHAASLGVPPARATSPAPARDVSPQQPAAPPARGSDPVPVRDRAQGAPSAPSAKATAAVPAAEAEELPTILVGGAKTPDSNAGRVAAAASAEPADSAAARGQAEHRRGQIQEFLSEADAARAERNWTQLIATAERLQALDPSNPYSAGLRAEAEAGLERERLARRQALAAAIADGRRAIQAGRYAEAEAHLVRAAGNAGQLGAAGMRDEVAQLQAMLVRARRASGEVSRAQALFDAGERAEAIDVLTSLLSADPEAGAARSALERLSAEATRLAEFERKQAEVVAHLEAAEQAWLQGDDARTRDEASAALSIEPTLDRAVELLIDGSVRMRQSAAREARLTDARAALAETRGLLDKDDWAKAASRAAFAAIVPETAEAGRALLLEVLQHESDQRIDNLRSRTERDRRREVDRLLNGARTSLRSRDWSAARLAAENALVGDPDNAEARALIKHAIQRTAPGSPVGVPAEAGPAKPASTAGADEGATVLVPQIELPPPRPGPRSPQAKPVTPSAPPPAPPKAPAPANPQHGGVFSKLKPWVIRGRNKGDS